MIARFCQCNLLFQNYPFSVRLPGYILHLLSVMGFWINYRNNLEIPCPNGI